MFCAKKEYHIKMFLLLFVLPDRVFLHVKIVNIFPNKCLYFICLAKKRKIKNSGQYSIKVDDIKNCQ